MFSNAADVIPQNPTPVNMAVMQGAARPRNMGPQPSPMQTGKPGGGPQGGKMGGPPTAYLGGTGPNDLTNPSHPNYRPPIGPTTIGMNAQGNQLGGPGGTFGSRPGGTMVGAYPPGGTAVPPPGGTPMPAPGGLGQQQPVSPFGQNALQPGPPAPTGKPGLPPVNPMMLNAMRPNYGNGLLR